MNEKGYMQISSLRLLNVIVKRLDNNEILYEGMTENAPDDIKDKSFLKVEGGNPLILYV